MQQSIAVIGSAFGDEGKGHIVDYLASQDPTRTIVVRFNGGANAAHTVYDPTTRKKHQFGHFGSGSLLGVPTYLSKFFIANPFLLRKELQQFSYLFNLSPKIYIDPTCAITTPWDMLINQAVENVRKNKRHGTCGVGINETIERNEKFDRLLVSDIEKPWFNKYLRKIISDWMPARCEKLGISIPEITYSDMLFDDFVEACNCMVKACKVNTIDCVRPFGTVIFEGAQGLLLDETNKTFFPHVTRSRTGIHNVNILAKELSIEDLEVIYVTRCYTTRHGEGRLDQEFAAKPFANIHDDNTENGWQGPMRFAPLDLGLFTKTVGLDFKERAIKNAKFSIAVTCLDQVGANELIPVNLTGLKQMVTPESLINDFLYIFEPINFYLSYGPTRNDITNHMSQRKAA